MIPEWWTETLRQGDTSPAVAMVRRKLGMAEDGDYDAQLAARVRGFQQYHLLDTTGEVDAATATALGRGPTFGMVPTWFTGAVPAGSTGSAVEAIRAKLGLPGGAQFDGSVRDAVLRWQSAHGFPLTGIVDEDMAIQLGD